MNRTGPSIHPWDAPLVTGLQLDIVLLITTLQAVVQPSFNPPHCLLIQPILPHPAHPSSASLLLNLLQQHRIMEEKDSSGHFPRVQIEELSLDMIKD